MFLWVKIFFFIYIYQLSKRKPKQKISTCRYKYYMHISKVSYSIQTLSITKTLINTQQLSSEEHFSLQKFKDFGCQSYALKEIHYWSSKASTHSLLSITTPSPKTIWKKKPYFRRSISHNLALCSRCINPVCIYLCWDFFPHDWNQNPLHSHLYFIQSLIQQ